jgi:hypothetical protein
MEAGFFVPILEGARGSYSEKFRKRNTAMKCGLTLFNHKCIRLKFMAPGDTRMTADLDF